jgi:hypothetical protein
MTVTREDSSPLRVAFERLEQETRTPDVFFDLIVQLRLSVAVFLGRRLDMRGGCLDGRQVELQKLTQD